MSLTPANLQTRLPEFADADAGLVQMCLDEAAGEVNRKAWGGRADRGVLNLAAHLLVVSELGKSAKSGPVASKRVGGVSISYDARAAMSDAMLQTTPYGAEYLRLRSLVLASRVLGGV